MLTLFDDVTGDATGSRLESLHLKSIRLEHFPLDTLPAISPSCNCSEVPMLRTVVRPIRRWQPSYRCTSMAMCRRLWQHCSKSACAETAPAGLPLQTLCRAHGQAALPLHSLWALLGLRVWRRVALAPGVWYGHLLDDGVQLLEAVKDKLWKGRPAFASY